MAPKLHISDLQPFGALAEPVDGFTAADLLGSPEQQANLVDAWRGHGGFLVVRGWPDLTPQELVAVSGLFGQVEPKLDVSKTFAQVAPGCPVMRLGNTRNDAGELTAVLARDPRIPESGCVQYRPKDRKPMWHTDSTYRKAPPIGSALFCRRAPLNGGGETCFADMSRAYESLDPAKKAEFEELECVCSLAHHDAKVNKTSPEYPTLTEEQRLANPPVRVPMVLAHPLTGNRALYGMNSSTCAIVKKGAEVPQERMDRYEIEALEDESVQIWRKLLPEVTSKQFTVTWKWREGDIVFWDNRCTMHCATGFDYENDTREMWRVTLSEDHPNEEDRQAKRRKLEGLEPAAC